MNDASPNPVRVYEDTRGVLGVSEFSQLPFVPQRFFWLCGVGVDANRAGHGHKTCHQFLICLQGAVRVIVEDRNGDVANTVLRIGESFHLRPYQWLDLIEFEKNTVLGVYASHPYDFADYIIKKDDLYLLSE